MTMTGTGKATAVPDEVSFTVAVAVTRGDLSAALDEGSATMRSVLTSLEEHDVTKADMQTTGCR